MRQVWRYEGARTLAAYLRRRDCVPALARDLGVPADAAAATVLRHILESLAARSCPSNPALPGLLYINWVLAERCRASMPQACAGARHTLHRATVLGAAPSLALRAGAAFAGPTLCNAEPLRVSERACAPGSFAIKLIASETETT